ncbi:3-hydroxyisobutyryl-CoA hydrolase 1-like protein [Tanacetum coccineum]|uniref:3-hydroxyisobutyryl-CoA hydrolase n=1 Tax=Tanacetum coccineum TaxID=301880 RepID=A0ABQ5C3P8_9ASTR
MDYCQIVSYLETESHPICKGFYFLVPGTNLEDGLRSLKNDVGVRNCRPYALRNNSDIDIYMAHSHFNEHIRADSDVSENEDDDYDVYFVYNSDNDDTASLDQLSDGEDEVVDVRIETTLPKTKKKHTKMFDDNFLTRLFNGIEREKYIEKEVKGLIEGVEQLKRCVTFYALANVLKLYYEINEGKRLVVRCSRDNHGKSMCPYRLWESWMQKERSFQVKTLADEHTYSRTYEYDSLITPKQLNVLSGEMVSRLLELFLSYEEDPNVKLIIMKGEGRAFCAGGDVAAVVNDINNGNWKLSADFSSKQFRLNYLMATYTKPQVSLLRGIVMGGGAGASIHGRFRVATDNSYFLKPHSFKVNVFGANISKVFAMPETALGLFPDVGASYYLSRTPGLFGEYVGLTGARLDGAEMLACGLATHFVPLEKLPLLEDALCKANTGDPNIVNNIINEYSSTPKLKEKSQYFRLKTIERCFSRRTVEDIISALEKEADKNMDDWIAWTIKSLKKASPTSLKISLRSIREGRLQGVGQCFIREYRMVCTVFQGKYSRDFSEGYRALLLDKDKNPKWEPSKLEFVSDSMVDRYFAALDDKDWEDLKLPARSNLPSYAISKL